MSLFSFPPLYDLVQGESDSVSDEGEEGEASVGIPLPEGTWKQIQQIRLQRSQAEDAQELQAFRANQDKFLKLREKDDENWYKGPSTIPPQVCFLGLLRF